MMRRAIVFVLLAGIAGALTWLAALPFAPQGLQAQTPDPTAAASATLMEKRRLTAAAVLAEPATPTPPRAGSGAAATDTATPTPTPQTKLWMSPVDAKPILVGERLALSGRGQPGASVQILVDEQLAWTTIVGPSGSWSARIRLAETGDHSIHVLQLYRDNTVDQTEYQFVATVVEPSPTPTDTPSPTPIPSPTSTDTPSPTPTMTDTPSPTPTPDLLRAVEMYRSVEQDMLRQPQVTVTARLQAITTEEAREELQIAARDLLSEGVYQVLQTEVLDQAVLAVNEKEGIVYELLQRTLTTYSAGQAGALSQEIYIIEMYYRLTPDQGEWKVAVRRGQNYTPLDAPDQP